ncbi:hypothetical protein C8F01DRAFT_1082211 [Mycena amicta]|nr:hypothetical protein C8F01DRAFT_1082211 [Mycena amicta]
MAELLAAVASNRGPNPNQKRLETLGFAFEVSGLGNLLPLYCIRRFPTPSVLQLSLYLSCLKPVVSGLDRRVTNEGITTDLVPPAAGSDSRQPVPYCQWRSGVDAGADGRSRIRRLVWRHRVIGLVASGESKCVVNLNESNLGRANLRLEYTQSESIDSTALPWMGNTTYDYTAECELPVVTDASIEADVQLEMFTQLPPIVSNPVWRDISLAVAAKQAQCLVCIVILGDKQERRIPLRAFPLTSDDSRREDTTISPLMRGFDSTRILHFG